MKLRWIVPAYALGAFALTGCHSHTSRTPERARQFPGVTVQDVTFRSVALSRDVTYRVYLPSPRPAGKGFPTVYLLHGGGGGFQDWSAYSDAGSYAARGLILVMPDGDSSYWMNAVEAPADRYQDFLINDLMGDVESRFPAERTRRGRAVVGVSMGGFAAVELALSHPDLFAFAGAISPALDVPSRKFSWRRWAQSMRFRRIFGADGSVTRRAADPFVLVKTADPARTPFLFISAGENEPLRKPIERFVSQLNARGFADEFQTRPGGHDWSEWNAQVPGCFESLVTHVQ